MSNKNVKQFIALIVVFSLVFNLSASSAYAFDRPSKPSAPSAPDAPSSPDAPDTPTFEDLYEDDDENESNSNNSNDGNDNNDNDPTPTQIKKKKKKATPTPTPVETQNTSDNNADVETQVVPTPTTQPEDEEKGAKIQDQIDTAPRTSSDESSGGQRNNGNTSGEALIETGDVEGAINVGTDVNTNNAETGVVAGNNYAITNEKNGAKSDNDAVISDFSDIEVDLDNEADLTNIVDVDYSTGDNKVRDNLGDGSKIKTGDVTSTVNIFNFANTNITGVDVSSNEFNVDDQTGDIDLTGVTSGICSLSNNCGGNAGNASITNESNGAKSDNDGILTFGNNLVITNDNYAELENDINIEVDTGDNLIADSHGDASIETGDASVVANIFNFLNTNLVGLGEIVVNTVNVLSDYAGDIILPSSAGTEYAASYEVNNEKNGANSINNAEIKVDDTTNYDQNNDAIINNVIKADANTGDNRLKDTISGSGSGNSVQTGDINSKASAQTVANQNFIGEDMNIIIHNDEGNTNLYMLDADGQLVPITYEVSNVGNGAGSENNAAIHETNNTDVTQNNTALVDNNINIDANTGDNTIKDNLGGSSQIDTGDVNIFAGITNFVNNNFIGGNIVFTVVNDFMGFWSGGFSFDKDDEQGNQANTENVVADTSDQSSTNAVQEKVTSEAEVDGEGTITVDSDNTSVAMGTVLDDAVGATGETQSSTDITDSGVEKSTEQNIVEPSANFETEQNEVIDNGLVAGSYTDTEKTENNTTDEIASEEIAALGVNKVQAKTVTDMSDVDFGGSSATSAGMSILETLTVGILLLSGLAFIFRSALATRRVSL